MKPIKIHQQQKEALIKKFKEFLNSARLSDSKINFSTDITNIILGTQIKPTIYFTTDAWIKIKHLVKHTSTEIGWHGTVYKTQNDTYYITNILVYPQTVSGASVNTDTKEYSEWLQNLDDETFNHNRFQGHSHVNFSCSPSGVDKNFYDSILQTLREGDFYIFMIINKRHDYDIWLYDFKNNIIFEKQDLTIDIICQETKEVLTDWFKNANKNVKTEEIIRNTYFNDSPFESSDYYDRYKNVNTNVKHYDKYITKNIKKR